LANEETIFAEALGKGSAEEQSVYLDQACAGNAELRRAVDALLLAHQRAGGILEAPAIGLDVTSETRPASEAVGSTIGPYKLLQQIGEGGMGVVYMAEQRVPVTRKVALKIIKLGMDTKQVIARFEAERQALALMDHPNIARVLEAGATDSGRPYFVMELVKGVPITRYCDEHHVEPRHRLELFVQVCQAVQHAHQKGIIHRDIKPSNVLVAEFDEKPVAKVIDFGVAKAVGQQLTEKTMFTAFGQVIGTIEYMSPEHAKLNQLDIDTRSDIYSLGVLLYELLTGETPFDRKRLQSAALDEMLRIIREDEPVRPSTRLSTSHSPSIAANRGLEPKKLSALVHGELDWIVMKSLEKDRNRRYETANGFAIDVQHYLTDEAVQACPPSAVYRFRKFARRNKVTLAVSGLVVSFLMLLGGGIGLSVRDRTARQARVSGQLELILADVARLEQAENWSEALASARRAEPGLATGEAAPGVQERARQGRADLELVRRIEEIRAESGTAWGSWRGLDPKFNVLATQAEQDYAAAFGGAGIDVDTLSAEEAAKRITARGAIAAAVLPALDDWVAVRSKLKDESATRRLIDVLRIADPDPWRQRVRDCLARKDWAALENLVSSPDLDRQPAATISFLCSALRKQAEADTDRADGVGSGLGHRGFFLEIDVLRRAQFNYPADFWINYRLGISMIWLKSPPLVVQEGIGYLRAAVALRPHEPRVLADLGRGYDYLGEFDQAMACYRKALALAPQDVSILNSVAWHFATTAVAKFRDPHQAVKMAKTAVELRPQSGAIRNTLGVARYRAGDFKQAIEDLKQSTRLRKGGSSSDFFFLAMAHWQLGDKDQARKWYEQAIEWMDKNQPENEELRRFRTEAAELLNLPGEKPTTQPQSK
jgi:serine/threonine protein kinase/tetratricopeptide (TPR) repeat protein